MVDTPTILFSKGGKEERGEWNKMQILTRFNRAATHGRGHKTTPFVLLHFSPKAESLALKERAIEKTAILFQNLCDFIAVAFGGPACLDGQDGPSVLCLSEGGSKRGKCCQAVIGGRTDS